MSYLLRSAIILSGLILILGSLAYFQPGLFSQLGVSFWDGPRQLQDYCREEKRSRTLEDLQKRMVERRAEMNRIVEALCREEFGLAEAANRIHALETERNLPPLRWGEPKEKWPELLYQCLIEQAAVDLAAEPEKAKRILPRLVKEAEDKYGVMQLELPLATEQNWGKANPGPVQPIGKARAVAD
jgi:hypothetical protein